MKHIKKLEHDGTSLDSWRVLRILSEFVDGFEALNNLGPSVSIFGSARTKPDHPHYQLAVEVSKKIAEKGFSIITGGGPGIMEAANRGAQEASSPSCGLCIDLPFETKSNDYIDPTLNLKFRYFFIRKVMFVRYAMAFVVLPGGLGTLDEFFEALTLMQTHKIRSFPVFLVGKAYWSGLIDWMKNTMLTNGYIDHSDLNRFIITDDPEEIASAIFDYSESLTCPVNF